MSHTDAVQAIYAAFARGDAAGMAAHLAPDVDWEYGGRADAPWLAPGRGAEGFAGFLAGLAGLEVERFDVKALLAGDDVVVALIDLEATVKATGRRIVEIDEAHIWRFGADGKVARFRHRVDTHQHRLAAGLG